MRRVISVALCLAIVSIFASCGQAVPHTAAQWPAESLPEGFPVLEGADEVRDGTEYGGYLEIVWNGITKPEADTFAAAVNGWLDGANDSKIFYDDTLKYYTDGSKCTPDGDETVHINFTLLPDGSQYNLTLKLSGNF